MERRVWRECHAHTPCILAEPEDIPPSLPTPADVGSVVVGAITDLSDHWLASSRTTAVDPTHEGTFAFALYALVCLLELIGPNRRRIACGRLASYITECRITFAYLRAKNDSELWSKFRRYGAGQAKLVLLKIRESAIPPHSISVERLEQLANEDVWQEFVDINLGSWAGIDLRRMADESGTKDLYDAHYGWSSSFAHGHWSAMRDTTLSTCLNPLHRAHRIPLSGPRVLGDVLPDALTIVEAMLADVVQDYPGKSITLRGSNAERPAEDGQLEASPVVE